MKKVGLLISQMNKGGAERVVSRLTHILSDQFLVHLILFEDTFMEYDYSGKLINMDIKAVSGVLNKISLLIKRTRALRNIKKEYELDVVISFLDSPNIVNILSKTEKCKIGVSIRNYSAHENVNSLVSKLTNFCIKFLYNRADAVIPVTKVIANSYIKDFGINKDKIKVIYNPYDIEQIQKLSREDLEVEYKNFITKGKTFISVGRHMYQKGFWHLVKSFKLVQEQHNDAKLIIVGKDYDNGKVQKLVKDMGLSENVLLTGQQENPYKFIKNSDVYVLSSLFEGFPNAMVEAMACGCPVIATDCKSGPREILLDNYDSFDKAKDIIFGDYGILVPSFKEGENWEASIKETEEYLLANAMLDLLSCNEKHKFYSQKSVERARVFNYEKCFKEFKDLINNI